MAGFWRCFPGVARKPPPPQLSERELWGVAFTRYFGFPPELLGQAGRKKEVLIELGILARSVRVTARDYESVSRNNPHDRFYGRVYIECRQMYEQALASLAQFDPEMVRQLPHWSEFPDNVAAWINGARVEVRPAAGEIELAPPPEVD